MALDHHLRKMTKFFSFCCVRVLGVGCFLALGLGAGEVSASTLPGLIEEVLAAHPSIRSQRSQGRAAQEAEAKVYPADIGLLRLGLPVAIKVDAFDYSIYGMLDGELTYISPDTLSEQGSNGQTQTYYRVRARITPPQAGNGKTRQDKSRSSLA